MEAERSNGVSVLRTVLNRAGTIGLASWPRLLISHWSRSDLISFLTAPGAELSCRVTAWEHTAAEQPLQHTGPDNRLPRIGKCSCV